MINQPKHSHILVVSQLPPPVNGSTIMTKRFMDALAKAGYNCSIVEKPFSRTMEEVEKINIVKILKIPILVFRLLEAILRVRPTMSVFFITVGFGSFLVDCFLLWILKVCNIDYVIYVHGRGLNRWGKHAFVPVRFLAKKTLMSSFGGIVLGERLKDDVIDYIPDSRLHVLPNGIPDEAVHYSRDLDVSDTRMPVIVLFLSNLIPAKGPLNFLEMAKKIIAQEKNVRFVMAGKAVSCDFTEVLQAYIVKNNLEDYIELRGGVYEEHKSKLFQQADIFVFPSTKETFGVVNLEAMQWALPVVSTNIGAIPEVVIDNENGYIVQAGDVQSMVDKVLHLIRNPGLRKAMGQKGRERFLAEYSQAVYERKVREAVVFFAKNKFDNWR